MGNVALNCIHRWENENFVMEIFAQVGNVVVGCVAKVFFLVILRPYFTSTNVQ